MRLSKVKPPPPNRLSPNLPRRSDKKPHGTLPTLSISSKKKPEPNRKSPAQDSQGKTSSRRIVRSHSDVDTQGFPRTNVLDSPRGEIRLGQELQSLVARLHGGAQNKYYVGGIHTRRARIICVGDDSKFRALLKGLPNEYRLVLHKSKAECLADLQSAAKNGMTELFGVALFAMNASSESTTEFIHAFRAIEADNVGVIVLDSPRDIPLKDEVKHSCRKAGVNEVISVSSSPQHITGVVYGLLESLWFKSRLSALLNLCETSVKMEEGKMDDDTKTDKATRDRMKQLEDHLKILEEYKVEAQQALLQSEERSCTLKGEIISLKEEIETLQKGKVARAKWQSTAESIRLKARATKQKEEKKDFFQDQDQNSLNTPMQSLQSTLNRLSKVSSLLDPSDMKNVFSSVVKTLQDSNNLYTPSVEVFDKMEMDDASKEYLISTFTTKKRLKRDSTSGSFKNLVPLMESQHVIQAIKTGDRIRTLSDWNYLSFQHDGDEKELQLLLIATEWQIFDTFPISGDEFRKFLAELRLNYNDNPYHSWHHAVDICQMIFLWFKASTKLNQVLNGPEKLALFLAALTHDVQHPGTNNAFQIETQSELALLYNDKAVLENHHTCTAFRLFKQFHIFDRFESEDFKIIRKYIIESILSTDMKIHFELVSKFASHLQARMEAGEPLIQTNDDSEMLLGVILHSADISNMVRPEGLSLEWSNRVYTEFLLQGDQEKDMNIPVSPFMDRDDPNQPLMSCNFIDFIVKPLFKEVVKAFPELSPTLEHLDVNRKHWEGKKHDCIKNKK